MIAPILRWLLPPLLLAPLPGAVSAALGQTLPEPEIQYPFVCTTVRNGLGQPIVDNQTRQGIPVAREDEAGRFPMDQQGYPADGAEIVGWSRDCEARPDVRFYYRLEADGWKWVPRLEEVPSEGIAQTTTTDGKRVPLIARVERGTVERFIYSIAMLVNRNDTETALNDRSLWNGRLLFSFQGGVAIGHSQGTWSESAALYEPALRLGYAVLNSTGVRTSSHYNLIRGGRVALRAKELFMERHGQPQYTVAVGGSGGAVQQYIYQQNHPGLLDGGVAQYAYPDMVTQTIHIGDCELLEHYFERTDAANPRWRDVEERQRVMGLNAEADPALPQGERDRFEALYTMYAQAGIDPPEGWQPGGALPLSECRPGWYGLTPLAMNPTATNVQGIDRLAQGADGVRWTHWDDAREVYGVDAEGWARQTWDNEGVQYGLRAVSSGEITPAEFLRLNALVGGWKHASEMVPEGCPHDPERCGEAAEFDPWSARQMNLSVDGRAPAPRTRGDTVAIRNAHERGHVFLGRLNIPIVDWRHYLEHRLDMHNSHQSFAARQRIVEATGDHGAQLIWFTDARPGAPQVDHTPEALQVLHEWITNIRENPDGGIAANRPESAVDRCWATDGSVIAAGEDVWAGVLDEREPGACTSAFPLYTTSRIEAGAPIRGDLFRCALRPVREAVTDGIYGVWRPAESEIERLEEIFPTGVCDHSRPGYGQ